jgi:hypothetical protein
MVLGELRSAVAHGLLMCSLAGALVAGPRRKGGLEQEGFMGNSFWWSPDGGWRWTRLALKDGGGGFWSSSRHRLE